MATAPSGNILIPIGFPYINEEDVSVWASEEEDGIFTLVPIDDYTVEMGFINLDLAYLGQYISVRRMSQIHELIETMTAPSPINGYKLTIDFTQLLYLIQEIVDGQAGFDALLSITGISTEYEIQLGFETAADPETILTQATIGRACTITAGLGTSRFSCGTPPTEDQTILLRKNRQSVGSLTIDTAGTTTVNVPSAISLVKGDVLDLYSGTNIYDMQNYSIVILATI